MFSKLSIVFTTTLAILVAAGGPIDLRSRTSSNSCNTGPVQCCNEVHRSSSQEAVAILRGLSIDVPVGAFIGSECSPISVIGIGGGPKCQQQPLCCENNNFKGAVVVGCSPINVNV